MWIRDHVSDDERRDNALDNAGCASGSSSRLMIMMIMMMRLLLLLLPRTCSL